jgi:hypothetical protein
MPSPSNLAPELEEAIIMAVRHAGQSDAVAHRVIAWIHELSAGKTSLERRPEVHAHFEAICNAMKFEETDHEG